MTKIWHRVYLGTLQMRTKSRLHEGPAIDFFCIKIADSNV